MLIWLLRILLVLVLGLVILVLLIGLMVLVLVEISLLAVPMPLLLPRRAMLLIGCLLLTFLSIARFRIDAWIADVSCPVACRSLSGLLAGWILLIDLLHHRLVLFRMSGMFIGMFLGLFLIRLFVP